MSLKLGRIEHVDLRSIWTSEDREFTPWLAKEENLKILGDVLGIELELEAEEKDVGPFRADILCKNTLDDTWVIIENQLEKTDHTHLGQLLTYAAGLNAKTIVWISSDFRDEHRAALDWLNEMTSDSVSFFGLKVELWKIGNSPAAPRFNVVCQPNDWSNDVTKGARRVEAAPITSTQELQLKYWTGLSQYLAEYSTFHLRTPSPQGWADFSLGKTNAFLRLSINTQAGRITAGLCLYKNMKSLYDVIFTQKEAIEKDLGYPLIWENDPDKQTAVIKIERPVNISQESSWREDQEWLAKRLDDLGRVFRPLVRQPPKMI